jgi:hypothetical protein
MTDIQEGLVARLHRKEVERLRGQATPPPEVPAIDLSEEPTDPALAAEWKVFRLEVARLPADGCGASGVPSVPARLPSTADGKIAHAMPAVFDDHDGSLR